MSRQFKNGTCSCWKKIDAHLAKQGTELAKAVQYTGHEFLELRTRRVSGKSGRPKRFVCTFCPFCGAKLK